MDLLGGCLQSPGACSHPLAASSAGPSACASVAMDEAFLRLDEEKGTTPRRLEERAWWRAIHALAFLTGGTTFCAGTALFYFPGVDNWALISAVLYIIGSVCVEGACGWVLACRTRQPHSEWWGLSTST